MMDKVQKPSNSEVNISLYFFLKSAPTEFKANVHTVHRKVYLTGDELP
jgi:hypothetical protein